MTNMSDVDLETGKVQVEVFSQTEAALAALRQECAEIPDFNDPEGYEIGKERLNRLTKYRTTLEKERKRIKAPYLEASQIIDGEARRITGHLVKLEEPLKTAKQAVDEREKRQKEERLARLRAKIDDMTAYVDRCRNRTSAEIAEVIEHVDAIDTQADFYELTDEAVRAQADTLEKLGAMYSDRLQYEQAEKARREAEAEQRAERERQAIEQRINKIRMAPMDLIGKPAGMIRTALDSMVAQYPSERDYGDRYGEAEQAHEQALTQLRGMLTQAEQLEEAQAAESRRKDEQLKRDMAATTPGMTQEEAERTPGTGVATHPAVEERKTEPAPGCEVPPHYGIDLGGAGEEKLLGEAIPAEDMASTSELKDKHQAMLDRINEAVEDLYSAGYGVSHAQAEQMIDAIIAGEVRHVHFDALDGE